MTQTRWMAALVAVALAAPATAPLRADVQYVRCESGRLGRYKQCAAKTEGQVELVRELSDNRCQQWKSWGYDRDGVWVDRGCRAEFRVGKDGGGAGKAVAVGAVAGAAILGAILATKKGGADEPAGQATTPASVVPEWARGRFRGFSPKLDTEFDITVARDGKVTGTADGKAVTGQSTAAGMLQLGELEFEMSRETWGFAAKQKGDADNVIYFRRRS